jgi:Na+/citrate or Na+/malate symporter
MGIFLLLGFFAYSAAAFLAVLIIFCVMMAISKFNQRPWKGLYTILLTIVHYVIYYLVLLGTNLTYEDWDMTNDIFQFSFVIGVIPILLGYYLLGKVWEQLSKKDQIKKDS